LDFRRTNRPLPGDNAPNILHYLDLWFQRPRPKKTIIGKSFGTQTPPDKKKKSGNMGQVPRFYDWLNFHNGTKKTIERWLKFNGFPNEDEFWLIPNRNEL
jgi:hypothetical protein